MIDYIRTLLWVNHLRLRAHKLPLLKMPKDEGYSNQIRNTSCPVAKALETRVSNTHLLLSFGYPGQLLPLYVQRYILRQDMKAKRIQRQRLGLPKRSGFDIL